MAHQVTRSITVRGDPQRLYELWSQLERFPVFIPGVKSVMRTGGRHTRWTIEGPLGRDLTWEAETTTAEPGRRLAWNTTCGEIRTSGQVVFADLGNGQTSVTVSLNWLAGLADPIAAALQDPDGMVTKALRAFKREAEEGAAAASSLGRAVMAVEEEERAAGQEAARAGGVLEDAAGDEERHGQAAGRESMPRSRG